MINPGWSELQELDEKLGEVIIQWVIQLMQNQYPAELERLEEETKVHSDVIAGAIGYAVTQRLLDKIPYCKLDERYRHEAEEIATAIKRWFGWQLTSEYRSLDAPSKNGKWLAHTLHDPDDDSVAFDLYYDDQTEPVYSVYIKFDEDWAANKYRQTELASLITTKCPACGEFKSDLI